MSAAADEIEHRLMRALQEWTMARDAGDIAATVVHRELALRYCHEAHGMLTARHGRQPKTRG